MALLSVGGDRRADSPGHSAKYGSCDLIDLDTNKVIGAGKYNTLYGIAHAVTAMHTE